MKSVLKNKGKKLKLTTLAFTLIELLAVIVILAIIALIATPIILNIIKDSKKEADKRTVEMYVKALENAIAQQQLDGREPLIGRFSTLNGREILQDGDSEPKLIVEYDGLELDIKTIDIYEDGTIYLEEIKSNDKILVKKYGIRQRYEDGEIVYIDITTGKSCTNYNPDNSIIGYNGYTNKDSSNNKIDKITTQNSCLKFYAFLDDGGKKINLLLDHNTSFGLAWNLVSNGSGPSNVKQQLYEDTKDWIGTIPPLDYKYNGVRSYTIEYSKKPEYEGATTPYKARLITADEIAKITGADKKMNWKEESSTEDYYFYNLSQDSTTGGGAVCSRTKEGCQFGWLYDRTTGGCTRYGCFNDPNFAINIASTSGYWTSSAKAGSIFSAWQVFFDGKLSSSDTSINNSDRYGVRPVIEVLKSNLN